MTTRSRKRTRTAKGALADVVEPQFVSLVETPANMTSFKIVRSADGEEVEAPIVSRGKRGKTKRADNFPIVGIILPMDITDEQALAVMESFGLPESDFEITERDHHKGIYHKKKKNTDVVEIEMGSGIVVQIERSHFKQGATNGVGVTALDFDVDKFQTQEAVEAYLKENEIDFKSIEDHGGTFHVVRGDEIQPYDSSTPSGTVGIGEGIEVHVVPVDEPNVPAKISRAVNTAALGQYGWGHVSFETAIVDTHYSEAVGQALYMLNEVLENIVFYNDSPIQDKRNLINQAVTEFAAYVGNLITAVTPEMVEQARSSKQETKETEMPKPNEVPEVKPEEAPVEEAKRSEADSQETETPEATAEVVAEEATEAKREEAPAEPAAATEATPAAEVPVAEQATLTRSDAEAIAQSAVQAYIDQQAAKSAEEAKRSEDDESVKVIRSLAESVESLTRQVKEMQETTVSRSDSDDPESSSQGGTFSGVLGFTRKAE